MDFYKEYFHIGLLFDDQTLSRLNRETESNRGSLEWPFLPYMFFDVYDGEERQDGG